MDNIRRNRFLMIADGKMELMPVLYHIDRLRFCDHVLAYMIKHRLMGDNLLSFFNDCDKSILKTMSELIKRIKKDSHRQEIIGGQDYRIG